MTMSADLFNSEEKTFAEEISNGGWARWSRYVLEELKRVNIALEKIARDYQDLCVKVELLRTLDAKFSNLYDDHVRIVMPFIKRETQSEERVSSTIRAVAVGVSIPAVLAFLGWLLYIYHSHMLPTK